MAFSNVASAGSFSTAARTLCLAVLADFALRLVALLPMPAVLSTWLQGATIRAAGRMIHRAFLAPNRESVGDSSV